MKMMKHTKICPNPHFFVCSFVVSYLIMLSQFSLYSVDHRMIMNNVAQFAKWELVGETSPRRRDTLVPHCPPQVPHDLTQERNCQLTTWAMAFYIWICLISYHSLNAFITSVIPCLDYDTVLSFSYMAGQVKIHYRTYIYNELLRIRHAENRIAPSYLFIQLLCSSKNFKYLLMFSWLIL